MLGATFIKLSNFLDSTQLSRGAVVRSKTHGECGTAYFIQTAGPNIRKDNELVGLKNEKFCFEFTRLVLDKMTDQSERRLYKAFATWKLPWQNEITKTQEGLNVELKHFKVTGKNVNCTFNIPEITESIAKELKDSRIEVIFFGYPSIKKKTPEVQEASSCCTIF